jgi:hypothetical protein
VLNRTAHWWRTLFDHARFANKTRLSPSIWLDCFSPRLCMPLLRCSPSWTRVQGRQLGVASYAPPTNSLSSSWQTHKTLPKVCRTIPNHGTCWRGRISPKPARECMYPCYHSHRPTQAIRRHASCFKTKLAPLTQWSCSTSAWTSHGPRSTSRIVARLHSVERYATSRGYMGARGAISWVFSLLPTRGRAVCRGGVQGIGCSLV